MDCEETISIQKASVAKDREFILLKSSTVYEYSIPHPDPKNLNSTAICYVQSDKSTEDMKFWSLNSVMFSVLKHEAFNTLRTKEQLGYIVSWRSNNMRKILGGSITVHSPKKDAEFLIHRINVFLDEQKNRIYDLTDEEFDKYRNSVITSVQVKDISLFEEAQRLWNEVYSMWYIFERQKLKIEALKSINKEDLIEYFTSVFLKDWRRINIKVTWSSHIDLINQETKEANSKYYIENGFEINQIDPNDIKSFQTTQILLNK